MKAILIALVVVSSAFAQQPLQLGWTNNMLRISGPQVPGDYVEIWYLEAFCRSGSTQRQWDETIAALARLYRVHKVELVAIGNGTA